MKKYRFPHNTIEESVCLTTYSCTNIFYALKQYFVYIFSYKASINFLTILTYLFAGVPVVTIPQNQYTINVGTDMTIPCNIQSNPQHTQVYWTKKVGNSAAQNIPQGTSDYGGGNVNSPSLIIYNIEEADEAQYNCFAVNIVGTGSASSPTFLNVIGSMCFFIVRK